MTISVGLDNLDARPTRIDHDPKAPAEMTATPLPETHRLLTGKLDVVPVHRFRDTSGISRTPGEPEPCTQHNLGLQK